MSGDQSEYKIQNAPLMTPEQRTMLSALLGGYLNMMQGTTFGEAYPGATSQGYNPKTFKGPIMKYTEEGKKIIDKDAGKKYRKKDGNGGNGDDGHSVPADGKGGSTAKGGKIGSGGVYVPREVKRVVQRGELTPRNPLTPTNPITDVLARQYTNSLVSPFLFTGNFPKRTGGY